MKEKRLCPEAGKFMVSLKKVLQDQDVLTSMDTAALELIGNTYHTYIIATNTLLKEGYIIKSARDDIRAHPCVKIQHDAQEQLTKLLDMFGLNPRARKDIQKSKERNERITPMQEFLSSVKNGN